MKSGNCMSIDFHVHFWDMYLVELEWGGGLVQVGDKIQSGEGGGWSKV